MLPNEPEAALSPAERRHSDRKKLIVDVQFNGGDATGIANTRDIGIGGLYMTTSAALDTGTLIFMKMTVGGRELSLSGVVAYTDPGHGVGVRFHGLSDENVEILKNELELG
ncbi:MAG TPA: PilZ domain-containing protein [Pyrinomonadaceae bacterium]|nr:PilZ domain-containing protein [Pyrinomonadaceae bacterium]